MPLYSAHGLPHTSSAFTPIQVVSPGVVSEDPSAMSLLGAPLMIGTLGDGTSVYTHVPHQSTDTRNSNASLQKVWARLPALPPDVSPSISVMVSPSDSESSNTSMVTQYRHGRI